MRHARIVFTLIGLGLTSAASAEGLTREVLMGAPQLNQVITQATAKDGQTIFEVCDTDLRRPHSPGTQGPLLADAQCRPLVDRTLDGRDSKVMALTQKLFAERFREISKKEWDESQATVADFGEPYAYGTMMAIGGGGALWSRAARTRRALAANVMRGAVIGGAAALLAIPVMLIVSNRRAARTLRQTRADVDRIAVQGRFIDGTVPMIDAWSFPLVQQALVEAVHRTNDALAIR